MVSPKPGWFRRAVMRPADWQFDLMLCAVYLGLAFLLQARLFAYMAAFHVLLAMFHAWHYKTDPEDGVYHRKDIW